MDPNKHEDLTGFTTKFWQRDLAASVVVFLVALPLCMGVALASGAPVTAGLVTGIIGGIVAGSLAGAPLQVSGPAAGLTVIVASLIQTHGIEMLGVCVLAAGALQLTAGYLRIGQWFRAVSPAVIQGMLAGIGILIFASQFHVMVDDKPHQHGWENLITIPQAVFKSFPVPELGTAEDRAEETRELQMLGLLHLQQKELSEEVHHLLTGIEQDVAIADNHRAQPPPATNATETHAVDIDTPAEQAIANQLHELTSRQTALLNTLNEFKVTKSPERYQQARAACQAALTDLEQGDIFSARVSQDGAEQALLEFLNSRKNHGFAALLGIITILAIISWKALPFKQVKLVPPALVAVTLATVFAFFIQLPVLYVEVPSDLREEIFFPTAAGLCALLDWQMWGVVLQLAVIGSAETLLCAAAVDRMHTGPRTNYDRELKAQGLGNLICGFLGALPMTGVIVRSSANIQAGGKTRLSAILHGVWLLLFVCLFAALLRLIPTSSLAAVLVFTGYKLVDYQAIRLLAKRGWTEVAIYVATAGMIVATDLLIGVLVGIGLSIAKLIYIFARLEVELEESTDHVRWELHLRGSATFLRLPKLAEALERVPANAELHVDVSQLDYIDAACLDLLDNWAEQNEADGAQLIIDAESLNKRFWRRRPIPSERDVKSGVAPIGVAHPHQKQQPI